jgi:hypothetical protein
MLYGLVTSADVGKLFDLYAAFPLSLITRLMSLDSFWNQINMHGVHVGHLVTFISHSNPL